MNTANDGSAGPDPTAGLLTSFALPSPLRERFEGSLGADLGAVRLHTGDASAEAAGALEARAFATGQDIHFGAGQYRPDDPFGQHLIAHEVAHTVQQAGTSPSPQAKLDVSQPSDPAEQEADRAADAMVAGEPASVSRAIAAVYRSGPLATPAGVTDEEKKAALDAEASTSWPKALAVRKQYDEAFAKASAPTADFSDLELDAPHGPTATKKTPITDLEGHQAFIKAWHKAFGKPIPKPVLALLVAQWKAEGGNTGITNNNVGNLTVHMPPGGGNPSSDYTTNSRPEVMADGSVKNVTQNFGSYPSPMHGALAMIRHMMTSRGALWMALLSGKVEDFAYVLKSYFYYSGPVVEVRVKGKLISWGYIRNMKDNMPSFEPEPTLEGGSIGIKSVPGEKSLADLP